MKMSRKHSKRNQSKTVAQKQATEPTKAQINPSSNDVTISTDHAHLPPQITIPIEIAKLISN